MLVDPQFDDRWRANLRIDHDILDVPRDRFLVAGDAWAQYRSGQADPAKFGIFVGDLRGVFRAPDPAFEELRTLYAGDPRLRVPATVHNALLDRVDAI
ncbi:MAG: hypothetical protein ACREMG_14625 [Gemmatimonadales bacterium]